MIREYKKLNVVDTFGDNGHIYEVVKQNKKYYLYQLQKFGSTQAYNFKILNKIMSSHILAICEEFQVGATKYIATDYAEKDLLKLQTDQPNSVFPLPVALGYFAKLISAIEQFHENRLVYRNIRPQVIKIRGDDLFFYDFTLSQFCKRKERMFDIVGCQSFLAPEFFSEDGYGFEVDIWAAGVLLFFMLLNEYPFKFKDKNQKTTLEELKLNAEGGFSFEKRLSSCKNPGFLKSNSYLQDFFKRIFEFDYTERISINKIKSHKLLIGYFPQKIDPDMLESIGEQGSKLQSELVSKVVDLKQYRVWNQIQKQQFILDFIEKCSESLMLDCCEYIEDNIIANAQFAILKVALIRVNQLIDICYGIKKPQINFDEQQFQIVKNSSSFKKTLSNIENKKKALQGLYRSAYLHLTKRSEDIFYNEEIPQDFNYIKTSYRLALSKIFEIAKNVMTKNKGNKPLLRKLTEVMARMVMMHLINRLFEAQSFDKNFTLYLAWNKNPSIENLDNWIHAQKQVNLKQFIKEITKNYL